VLENIGFGELLLIVTVIVLFFGPRKLPEIARTIGKISQQARKAMQDVQAEIKRPLDPNGPPKT
jgi:sec-independent protein translocase protein TatA